MTKIGSIKTFDLAIIGGGIVGAAVGRKLKLYQPNLSVCILEKESKLATHQSQRNSGVVHQGIYYKPDTLKARLCINGAEKIFHYCAHNNIPIKKCGKLVLATDKDELSVLEGLMVNIKKNGIKDVELIGKKKILAIQPECSTAQHAIWSPNTGIVDWQQVAHSFAGDFIQSGGQIIPNFKVVGMELVHQASNVVEIIPARIGGEQLPSVRAKRVVVCAGLHSDILARMSECDRYPKIVPFRGDYLVLKHHLAQTIKTNLYPVPNPRVPFLGVHITPRIDGSVIIGPNAMLNLKREGYKGSLPIDIGDTLDLLTSVGIYRLLFRPDYIKAGWDEIYRSMSRKLLVRQLRKFLPCLSYEDLHPTTHCGVRAQCVDRKGNLVDDFVFDISKNKDWRGVLHVRNCPSPAATSSLSIAEHIASIVQEKLLL